MFVAVLANRVYIIAFCPELSTPQLLFDFGMLCKDSFRRDAFDCLDDASRREVGNGLDEEMDVVLICSDFMKSDLVPLLDTEAHVLQRLCDLWCEYVPSILRWADEVVQEERFVVTLQDVFAHSPILARNAPAAELRGNLFEYILLNYYGSWRYERVRLSDVREGRYVPTASLDAYRHQDTRGDLHLLVRRSIRRAEERDTQCILRFGLRRHDERME